MGDESSQYVYGTGSSWTAAGGDLEAGCIAACEAYGLVVLEMHISSAGQDGGAGRLVVDVASESRTAWSRIDVPVEHRYAPSGDLCGPCCIVTLRAELPFPAADPARHPAAPAKMSAPPPYGHYDPSPTPFASYGVAAPDATTASTSSADC